MKWKTVSYEQFKQIFEAMVNDEIEEEFCVIALIRKGTVFGFFGEATESARTIEELEEPRVYEWKGEECEFDEYGELVTLGTGQPFDEGDIPKEAAHYELIQVPEEAFKQSGLSGNLDGDEEEQAEPCVVEAKLRVSFEAASEAEALEGAREVFDDIPINEFEFEVVSFGKREKGECPHCGKTIEHVVVEGTIEGRLYSNEEIEEVDREWLAFTCPECGGEILRGVEADTGDIRQAVWEKPNNPNPDGGRWWF